MKKNKITPPFFSQQQALTEQINQELEKAYNKYAIDGSEFYDAGLKEMILFRLFNQEKEKVSKNALPDSERLLNLRRRLESMMDEAINGFSQQITQNHGDQASDMLSTLKNEIQIVKKAKKFSSIRMQFLLHKLAALANDKSCFDREYQTLLSMLMLPLHEEEKCLSDALTSFSFYYAKKYDQYGIFIDNEISIDSFKRRINFHNKESYELYQQIIPAYTNNGSLGLNTMLYLFTHKCFSVATGEKPINAHNHMFGLSCSSLNFLLHDYSHVEEIREYESDSDLHSQIYHKLIKNIAVEGLTEENKRDLFFLAMITHEIPIEVDERIDQNGLDDAIQNTFYHCGSDETLDLDYQAALDWRSVLQEFNYAIREDCVTLDDKLIMLRDIKKALLDLSRQFCSRHAEFVMSDGLADLHRSTGCVLGH